MARKNMTAAQLKNLPQYRDKTLEELEEIAKNLGEKSFKERIEDYFVKYQEDYDITEMTENDRQALKELARVSVSLEDMVDAFEEAKDDGLWDVVGKINREIHRLRSDFSDLQRDLSITRRSRQETGQETIPDYIESLKKRAKHYMDKMLKEIYCPQCNLLIAKIWMLYPKENNTLEFTCGKCGRHFEVDSFEKNKNIPVGPPF